MATGAGMLGRIGVHASRKFRGLACVAGVALHFRDLVGVRIAFDVGVAGIAPQAAVNALPKGIAIYADVVTGGVLQALVGVACQAVRLGHQPARNHGDQHQGNAADQKSRGESPLARLPVSPENLA